MLKTRLAAASLLLIGIFFGFFVYQSEILARTGAESFLSRFPFKLGLDLSGGTELVYRADLSEVPAGDEGEALISLRDVLERRINLFGVVEPSVQTETTASGEGRLLIALPGVTDIAQAVAWVGETPALDFRTETENARALVASSSIVDPNLLYQKTELTGRFITRAQLVFNQTTGEPAVSLEFNEEGKKLFAKITGENVGKTVAIYLDGAPISAPVVQEAITDGRAQISGRFSLAEAKELVGRLNAGALPVPITLLSTQSIGATLGEEAVSKGVMAALAGFLLIASFFILWYRLPGLVAVVSLLWYVSAVLFLFKVLGITLTAAGIAGFIISIGIAVDANVLIFERAKEESRRGHKKNEAYVLGFGRAWSSIRDSNFSSLITAGVLFWFGTSLIQGFAVSLALGVLVSLVTALGVTRLFIASLPFDRFKENSFLLGSGFSR